MATLDAGVSHPARPVEEHLQVDIHHNAIRTAFDYQFGRTKKASPVNCGVIFLWLVNGNLDRLA
ncbi:hypothetical protein [Mesorhizobium escarrei]|uniref:hypothetical protein n=1 Tax=Mesorhizobium escarrei TaxID=666018 RepID=UPI0020A71BD8|nr:hypothetical protein [Mesorhizobium escarrei]